LDYFQPSHPVVAEGGPNGFTMVYSIDVGLRMPRDPKQGTYCGSLRAQVTKDSSVAKGFQRLPECNVVEIDISRIVTAWNPYSNFSWYHLGETTALDVGDTDRDGRREIAVASGKQAYLFELTNSSALKLHHEEKWISKPYERDLTDISVGDINGDSFDDIVLTSDRGIVNAFSLLDTNVTLNNYTREAIAPRNTPPPTGAVDPFFALGADFTDRTRFETLKITADEIDDVIVIDDFYIGAGDTSRLRYDDDYNEVLWAHDVPEFGRFTGESQLIDMDGDGKVELIAVFDHAITSIDPFDGSFIWNNTDVSDLDWANIVRNPQIGFIDLYLDSETLDLVVWSEVLLGGVPTTVFYVINFKGDVEFSTSFVGFANPVMKMVDVDVNGIDEILLTTRSIIFPLVSYMFVLKVSGSGDFNVLLDYLGFIIPITDILVGEFDPASQGEDWMYVMDFSALGLFFGIDWSIFPSIYMTFGLNAAGDVDVPDHGTFLGFAPYRGGTLEANVVDTNLDGYDDLIGQGSGGLYTMSTAPSGFALYNLANTYETSAVPYARNSIITGNFCDTDGLPDLVTPISSSSIGCYDSATFSTTPTLQWATDQISFDVIIDVIPGNFDNDSNANEFMIIGRNGFVFIYDNDGPGGSSADGLVIDLANVGLDDEPQRILPYTIGLVTVTTITILRKRKFKLPSFKLR
jgi:hypothetical protein